MARIFRWMAGITGVAVTGVLPVTTVRADPPPAATVRLLTMSPESYPRQVIAGPDGNLWVAQQGAGGVARVTPAGDITELEPSTGPLRTHGVTVGPDGLLWFAGDDRLVGMDTAGVVTSTIPYPSDVCCPNNLVLGADGSFWLAASRHEVGGQLVRFAPSGDVTAIDVANNFFSDVVVGPDGNLWVTQSGAVDRVSPAGEVTRFPLEIGSVQLTAGPDGHLWFANAGAIGWMSTDGVVLGRIPHDGLVHVIGAAAGAVWFLGAHTAPVAEPYVGRVDPATGAVVEFRIPTVGNDSLVAQDLTAGPDGNVWFIGYNHRIGSVALDGATTVTVSSSALESLEGDTVRLTATVRAAFDAGVPSGVVQFRHPSSLGEPNKDLGPPVPLVDGVATLDVDLPDGNYYISAAYLGDSTFRAGESRGIWQFVAARTSIEAFPVFLRLVPPYAPFPVTLAARLTRLDGEPVRPRTTVYFDDLEGERLCLAATSFAQPNYAACAIELHPDALARVLAGGGYTAVWDQRPVLQRASDDAGLIELTG